MSRIIAVADAYNAMTSDRPYRDAMPSRVARLRLAQAVESQFDTSVVAAFEAILASAGEDYRLAQRDDFREFAQSGEPDSSAPETSVADVACRHAQAPPVRLARSASGRRACRICDECAP